MARLYIVRHGEPTGSWGVSHDPDPGLSDLGKQQAQTAAERLRLLTPKHIVTSPLRRARETSDPLVGMLSQQALVAPAVAEVPTPPGVAMEDRGNWLRQMMAGNWDTVEPLLTEWRRAAIDYLVSVKEDTAIFSHYVLINTAVGAAIGDERVHCFAPIHASVTILDTNGRALSLVELGEAGTSAIR
jgi:broad specificity phosphatase PhoE